MLSGIGKSADFSEKMLSGIGKSADFSEKMQLDWQNAIGLAKCNWIGKMQLDWQNAIGLAKCYKKSGTGQFGARYIKTKILIMNTFRSENLVVLLLITRKLSLIRLKNTFRGLKFTAVSANY
jgi:hypothetical protein